MTAPAGDTGHVAFAIDAGYLPWCAVAALSCVEATTELHMHVHLLHDGSLTGNPGAAALVTMLEGHGATTELHELNDARVRDLPALHRFGSVVWLRFLLPDVLTDASRVVYLDADTMVASSLAPLLRTDLQGAPLGAVANVIPPEHRAHVEALGVTEPDGFLNSGVLLMDLDRMRSEAIADRLLATASDRAQELVWPDQDTLNLVFRHRWHSLHPRWNAQNSFWMWRSLALEVHSADALDEATGHPGVVHFEGPSLCKPWHALCLHPWQAAYWDILRRTPWADTRPEDLTVATRLIGRLPRQHQVEAYYRLLRWRGHWARLLPAGTPTLEAMR